MIFNNIDFINIICIILTSYTCNYIFNYNVIQKIGFSSKLIENIHSILNINNLTMIKMDKVLNNLTKISHSINNKENIDNENINGLNTKLITIENKNDFVDDKLVDIESDVKLIYNRVDAIDDKLDALNFRIDSLNTNLNSLLKILQKK